MEREDMSIDIKRYVWKPDESDKYLGVILYQGDCRYRVSNDFGFGSHQCLRLWRVMIEGYGFCTQHAKIIQRHMDQYPIKYGWDKK